jgi:hypothetical protein
VIAADQVLEVVMVPADRGRAVRVVGKVRVERDRDVDRGRPLVFGDLVLDDRLRRRLGRRGRIDQADRVLQRRHLAGTGALCERRLVDLGAGIGVAGPGIGVPAAVPAGAATTARRGQTQEQRATDPMLHRPTSTEDCLDTGGARSMCAFAVDVVRNCVGMMT